MSTNSQVVIANQQPNGTFTDSVTVTAEGTVGRSMFWPDTAIPDGNGGTRTYPAGGITPDVVLEERLEDRTIITENPVERGSMTSDHAYMQPSELEVCWAWSPSAGPLFSLRPLTFLQDQYDKLLDVRSKFILVTVVCGKRTYHDMLIEGLSVVTDERTENLLSVRIFLRQVILTSTETVVIASASNQTMPEKTAPIVKSGVRSLQPAGNFNYGP